MPTTEALKQLLDIVFDYKVVITGKKGHTDAFGYTNLFQTMMSLPHA